MTVYFDTETYPIRPGKQAPRIVCVQISGPDRILLREEGLDALEAALEAGETFVGHNVAFDMLAVIANRPRLLGPVFKAYEEDRVTCTMVRETLIRIAQGRLKSSNVSLLGSIKAHRISHNYADDAKSSSVRTTYAKYDGVPVDEWEQAYVDYAMEDLIVRDLYNAQEKYDYWLKDQFRQTRASFTLSLMSAWGMRTDPEAVEAFAKKTEEEHIEIKRRLIKAGLVRHTGTRNKKAAMARMIEVCQDKELPVPITDTGRSKPESEQLNYVSLTADDCEATGDSVLQDYARFGSVQNLRARTDRLRKAGNLPIQPRFNVLVDSGRTSCRGGRLRAGVSPTSYGDQVQNPHRSAGVREGYKARDGHVLISVDFSSAELHTLAQACTWMGFDSELARILNGGLDAHLSFACKIHTWDYDWAKANKRTKEVKSARQAAKAANFGFPGGLGATTFRTYAAAGYGVHMTQKEAQELKSWWFKMYPEMKPYFENIDDLVRSELPLRHFKSNRYRGGVTYCSAANSYFQGLASDMAKHSGFELAKKCYLPGNVLYGSRLWNFIHDEWILECPEGLAHECAEEIVATMEGSGRVWCPDVPVKAEPAISRSWRKGAEPVYRDGLLIPWEDRDMSEAEKEKIKKLLDQGMNPTYIGWEMGYETEVICSSI